MKVSCQCSLNLYYSVQKILKKLHFASGKNFQLQLKKGFRKDSLRGYIQTHFVMQNINLTFQVGGWVKYFSFTYCEFNSVAIFNIPHTNVSCSSTHFYHFSLSFYQYLFFTNGAFYIFNVNSVINILNNIYITYLFDRFLFCNYKVTGGCINIFHQIKYKSNTPKISITPDNNAFFLIIIFVIFKVFNRK